MLSYVPESIGLPSVPIKPLDGTVVRIPILDQYVPGPLAFRRAVARAAALSFPGPWEDTIASGQSPRSKSKPQSTLEDAGYSAAECKPG